MEHFMRLHEEPFELIKFGKKIIEIRLNDEKRQKVNIGDTITFSKLPDCEGKSMKWMLEKTYEIYTKEQEEKYGALGIRIEVID